MEIRFNFKKIKSSEALLEHLHERMGRLLHFENRPLLVHVVFEKVKGDCIVEARVREGRRNFKASATTSDFYHSVDSCVDKLVHQLAKKKRVVRTHRKPTKTKEAKLLALHPELDLDSSRLKKESA